MFRFVLLFSAVLTLLDATNEISDFSSFDTETKDEWRHSLEKGIQTFDRLIINNSLNALIKNHQLEEKFEEIFNLTNDSEPTDSALNNSVLSNLIISKPKDVRPSIDSLNVEISADPMKNELEPAQNNGSEDFESSSASIASADESEEKISIPEADSNDEVSSAIVQLENDSDGHQPFPQFTEMPNLTAPMELALVPYKPQKLFIPHIGKLLNQFQDKSDRFRPWLKKNFPISKKPLLAMEHLQTATKFPSLTFGENISKEREDPGSVVPFAGPMSRPQSLVPVDDSFSNVDHQIMRDVEIIEENLIDYISMADEPPFIEQRSRAYTFHTCCDEHFSTISLSSFLKQGNYNQQMAIIMLCMLNSVKNKLDCQKNIEVTQHARQMTMRALLSSRTKPESEKQAVDMLDSFLDRCNIDVQSINTYSLITRKFCAPVLILIWSPNDFVRCERELRSRKTDNLITSEEYPMVRSASYDLLWISTTLMNSLKTAYKRSKEILQVPLSPGDHLAVALIGQQIKPLLEEQEIKTYSSTFDEQPFRFERDSSLAYRSCCHSVENNDTFDFYIDVISTSAFDKNRWNQLFQQCWTLATFSDHKPCEISKQNLFKSLTDLKTHQSQHPGSVSQIKSIMHKLTSSIRVHRSIFTKMATYIDRYCRKHHVFELLFNPHFLVECEKNIRDAINGDQTEFQHYITNISDPFLRIVKENYKQSEDSRQHIRSLSETLPPPVFKQHSSTLMPFNNSLPTTEKLNDPLGSLASNEAPIIMDCVLPLFFMLLFLTRISFT